VTIDRTTGYAQAVASGRVVAGEFAIAAAKRHLDDLVHGPARGLRWDAVAAEKMIDSFPAYFTITDGPNAGQPFELLEWMLFVTGSLFGWYKGKRWRFDDAYVETAKGQGKSPWMACLGILMTGALGRQRAQVYAIAPKEDQAKVLFADAAAAIRSQMPDEDEGVTLESLGKFIVRGLGDNANKIEHPASRSVFQTASGNAGKVSGPRPTAVFVDELHELIDSALIDRWTDALAKNAAGGILIKCTNTPAQTQHVGTEYSERAQRIVTGQVTSDTSFVFITRVDVADRKTVFDTEAVWVKAMPALDITFPRENIRREVAKARINPSEAARVNRLFMGIPSGAVDFWLADSTMWDRCVAPIDLASLVNLPCWLSLDLSNIHDLTAVGAAWLDAASNRLFTREWYWTVETNLERRARADAMPYDIWAANGFISVVPGASIDKEYVAGKVAELVSEYDVRFLTYDVAMMATFVEACERVGLPVWRYEGSEERPGRGLKLVSHAQGTRVSFTNKQLCMPVSINALEERIREGTIVIDDNPVTYACAANAAPITDATGNRAFDKKRSRGRIDGLIVKAMAVGAAAMSDGKRPDPQILTL
jgi:phage terminase large subunit-like protein